MLIHIRSMFWLTIDSGFCLDELNILKMFATNPSETANFLMD